MQVTSETTPTATASPVTPGNAVAVHNLHVAWNSNLVLHGIHLEIPRGQAVAITGANGSGKSTLIRALMGSAPITRGSIQFFDAPADTPMPFSKIGYVPQRINSGGAVSSTCAEVVASGLLGAKKWWHTRADKRAVLEALDSVGLKHRAQEPFSILSGGQKQRVLIARALARKPEILIMDEPLAGIDQHSRQRLADVVAAEKAMGHTIILILHELSELGPHLDRELHLTNGKITYDGLPHLDESVDAAHRGGHHCEEGSH